MGEQVKGLLDLVVSVLESHGPCASSMELSKEFEQDLKLSGVTENETSIDTVVGSQVVDKLGIASMFPHRRFFSLIFSSFFI